MTFKAENFLGWALALGGLLIPSAASAKQGESAIQTGIQSLADRLAEAMGKKGDAGFMQVAVLPFDSVDDEAKRRQLGKISAELLSARLTLKPNVLQVERSRLNSIVEELKRSERGELQPKGAASVGRLLGASSIVLGSITTAGSDYVLTARLVDAETGQILTAADQSFPRAGMVALSEDMVEIKSRFGAAGRSAALPGWGQIYNGDTGRGVTYMAIFALTGLGAIASSVLGSQAQDEYNENTANTVDRRADANDNYDRANLMLLSMGVVWALSVTDAYITGSDRQTINYSTSGNGMAAGFSF